MKFFYSRFSTLRSRKGFTLIEMLIVVAIVAILSSVVLVGLGPTRRLGRDSRRISDLRQVQNGLELYFNKCGYYPGTAQASSPCGSFSAISTWENLASSLVGSNLGISNVPDDPTAGSHYFYGATAGGASYVLGARLEDAGNSGLAQDVDGTVNGVECNDPVYCAQL